MEWFNHSTEEYEFVLSVLRMAAADDVGRELIVAYGGIEFFGSMRNEVPALQAKIDEVLEMLKRRVVRDKSVQKHQGASAAKQTFSSLPKVATSMKLIPFDWIHLSPSDDKFVVDYLHIMRKVESQEQLWTKYLWGFDVLIVDFGAQIFLQKPALLETLLANKNYMYTIDLIYQLVQGWHEAYRRAADVHATSSVTVANTPDVSYSGTNLNDVLHQSSSMQVEVGFSVGYACHEIFLYLAEYIADADTSVDFDQFIDIMLLLIPFLRLYLECIEPEDAHNALVDYIVNLKQSEAEYGDLIACLQVEFLRKVSFNCEMLQSVVLRYVNGHPSTSLSMKLDDIRLLEACDAEELVELVSSAQKPKESFISLLELLESSKNHQGFNDNLNKISLLIKCDFIQISDDLVIRFIGLFERFLKTSPSSEDDELLLMKILNFIRVFLDKPYSSAAWKIALSHASHLSSLIFKNKNKYLHSHVLLLLAQIVKSLSQTEHISILVNKTDFLHSLKKYCLICFSATELDLNDRRNRYFCLKAVFQISQALQRAQLSVQTVFEVRSLVQVLTQTLGCILENFKKINHFTYQNRSIYRLITCCLSGISYLVGSKDVFGENWLFHGSSNWLLDLLSDDEISIQLAGIEVISNLINTDASFELVQALIPDLLDMALSFSVDQDRHYRLRSKAFEIVRRLYLRQHFDFDIFNNCMYFERLADSFDENDVFVLLMSGQLELLHELYDNKCLESKMDILQKILLRYLTPISSFKLEKEPTMEMNEKFRFNQLILLHKRELTKSKFLTMKLILKLDFKYLLTDNVLSLVLRNFVDFFNLPQIFDNENYLLLLVRVLNKLIKLDDAHVRETVFHDFQEHSGILNELVQIHHFDFIELASRLLYVLGSYNQIDQEVSQRFLLLIASDFEKLLSHSTDLSLFYSLSKCLAVLRFEDTNLFKLLHVFINHSKATNVVFKLKVCLYLAPIGVELSKSDLSVSKTLCQILVKCFQLSLNKNTVQENCACVYFLTHLQDSSGIDAKLSKALVKSLMQNSLLSGGSIELSHTHSSLVVQLLAALSNSEEVIHLFIKCNYIQIIVQKLRYFHHRKNFLFVSLLIQLLLRLARFEQIQHAYWPIPDSIPVLIDIALASKKLGSCLRLFLYLSFCKETKVILASDENFWHIVEKGFSSDETKVLAVELLWVLLYDCQKAIALARRNKQIVNDIHSISLSGDIQKTALTGLTQWLK